ncbi:copper resistance protein CopC [Enterobacter hormaechei]
MSILNKAILNRRPRYGRCFLCYGPSELKSSVRQADPSLSLQKIQLNFSENLTVKFSGAKLTMTGMKACHHILRCRSRQKRRQALTLNRWLIIPRTAFTRWHYRVDWRAVSSDTHPLPVITPLQ